MHLVGFNFADSCKPGLPTCQMWGQLFYSVSVKLLVIVQCKSHITGGQFYLI